VLTSSRDHVLQVWDLESGKATRRLVGHAAPVSWAAVSADGRRAVSSGDEGAVKVWDLGDGTCLRTLRIPPHLAFDLSPDGKRLAGCSGKGRLRTWDLESGQELRSVQATETSIHGARFVPGEERVVAARHDGALFLVGWEKATGEFQEGVRTPWAWAVAASPDGRRGLAGSRDSALRFWELGAAAPARVFEGHSGGIWSLAFSPDGSRALSGDRSGDVLRWDFGRVEAYRSFEPRVREASQRLGADGSDAEARKTLADWYVFRGRWDLARGQLEAVRAAGSGVSHLRLARCRWMTGDLEGARAEFERALQAKEAPEFYLRMCVRALDPAVGALDREGELKRRRAGDYPKGLVLVSRYPPSRWTAERIERLKEKVREGGALTAEELGFLEGLPLWNWMQQYTKGARKPSASAEEP
jgi:hypothetical protein